MVFGQTKRWTDIQKLVFGKKKKKAKKKATLTVKVTCIPLLPVISKSVETIDVVWDSEVEEIMSFVEEVLVVVSE